MCVYAYISMYVTVDIPRFLAKAQQHPLSPMVLKGGCGGAVMRHVHSYNALCCYCCLCSCCCSHALIHRFFREKYRAASQTVGPTTTTTPHPLCRGCAGKAEKRFFYLFLKHAPRQLCRRLLRYFSFRGKTQRDLCLLLLLLRFDVFMFSFSRPSGLSSSVPFPIKHTTGITLTRVANCQVCARCCQFKCFRNYLQHWQRYCGRHCNCDTGIVVH